MKRLIILYLCFLSICIKINAQSHFFDLLNMPMYEARVKLIDEFFARFNGKEVRKNVSDNYSDRKSNILMLFNLAQFKSKTDSLFLDADTLAQKIANDDVCLNYTDSCWYAVVTCHGTLAKNPVEFKLYLVVEERGDNMYKWVVANVEGSIFDTSRTKKHQELFLNPNAHEQSFMALSKMTTETSHYVDDYVRKDYEADALSVFLTLVRCNQLKIDYVSDVEFVFLQVPGYIFSVRHYERESMNAGWLISSFSKCDDGKKDEILMFLGKPATLQKEQVDNPTNELMPNGEIIKSDSLLNLETNLTVGEKVVKRFGDNLRLWCETLGSIDYRKNVIRECAGKDGKECRISDNLMKLFADSLKLPQIDTYTLASYMTGFQQAMRKGDIDIEFLDIKQIDSTDRFYIVEAKIQITGNINFESKDFFYIRAIDEPKISRISSEYFGQESFKISKKKRKNK